MPLSDAIYAVEGKYLVNAELAISYLDYPMTNVDLNIISIRTINQKV